MFAYLYECVCVTVCEIYSNQSIIAGISESRAEQGHIGLMAVSCGITRSRKIDQNCLSILTN